MSKPRVGREFQHLEDLTFIEGSQGALAAVEFLEKLSHDSSSIALKWDGSIVVYWGRDEAGDFVMTGKNGWGKAKTKSADELEEFIMTSGKGELWRPQFAKDMSKIFTILEQATPHWFRGYAKGDVLWHPGNTFAVEDNQVFFTPNQVTYYAAADSNIGRQIMSSQLGISVHSMYLAFGSSHAESPGLVNYLENHQVVLFSQTYITNRLDLDREVIAKLKDKVFQSSNNIDYVLETRPGLSDIKNIIYSYTNYLVKHNLYQQIENYFDHWLDLSVISNNKKEKIKNIKKENKGFDLIFSIVKDISEIKEKAIHLLDSHHSKEQEMVRVKGVNEGYVCTETKIKLVPRTLWKPR